MNFLINLIIRPQRNVYNIKDLGENTFNFSGQDFKRLDFSKGEVIIFLKFLLKIIQNIKEKLLHFKFSSVHKILIYKKIHINLNFYNFRLKKSLIKFSLCYLFSLNTKNFSFVVF